MAEEQSIWACVFKEVQETGITNAVAIVTNL